MECKQEGKKKEIKVYEMSRRKKSDFEMLEGEEIDLLRLRNENQAKMGEK